ncbi:unnamed protein product [Cuscuta campestris]|uniref:Reverse transcriptase zinc-binding domain-containing protein n=1 Tax=Cuscuta campestris TaxID=132261 RepID=A0A484M4R5_9ASTE|nr:unnamed protein product [Cuscuta campestris]
MNTANGYTVKDGYNWLKGVREKVDWAKVVWSRWSLPKHQFIAWLIWKGRIQTKDRLSNFLSIDTTCVLCEKEVESADHIFCSCTYAKAIHGNMASTLKVDVHADSIKDLGKKMELGRGRKQKWRMAAYITACCYFIWKARNEKIYNGKRIKEEFTFRCISEIVGMSLGGRGYGKGT